jgi:cbb3-type cytochrome c oxidase subunit II
MSALKRVASGWRAVFLIAITYVYFLIFAQFAFLKRLGQLGIEDAHLQVVMATMAIAGIAFSLMAASILSRLSPKRTLIAAFLLCGVTAALSVLRLNLPESIGFAFLIGAGLGLLTVTLVSNLGLWIGSGEGLSAVGLGTGLGYFICNLPVFFTAAPARQAMTAGVLCLVAILFSQPSDAARDADPTAAGGSVVPFGFVLVGFTALVWLDSAAFFIIQSTPLLKAGTWDGNVHLWTNGFLHFGAALLSAYLIRRRGIAFVLCSAVLALATACILLHDSSRIVLASLLYPVGVSLYSVALVAYPSLLADSTSPAERGRKAGLIYAVAGWFGSAMGIGMGQHLKQVPFLFVTFAVLSVFGITLFKRKRALYPEAAVVALALGIALCLQVAIRATQSNKSPSSSSSAIERGRRVYIAEGCINCHSQYVRPHTSDVLLWGPAETIEELRSQRPPLIGNRRQGPDLSEVGGRRSPLWLKAHFFNPGEVSHSSFMPSYSYLFKDSTRGDDLVQYLKSLKSPSYSKHILAEQAWAPSVSAVAAASAGQGALLYRAHCATCHEPDGATRLRWSSSFKRLPPDLHKGPWLHMQVSAPSAARSHRLTQIVKFGISGTDMPGHEYLSDTDVVSLILWLNDAMVQAPTATY